MVAHNPLKVIDMVRIHSELPKYMLSARLFGESDRVVASVIRVRFPLSPQLYKFRFIVQWKNNSYTVDGISITPEPTKII